MANVKFENVVKIYDNKVKAVSDFNLEVQDKEFVALVGPSGCGKSTTLRMLAGLEDITEGTISIDGVVVNDMEPKNRDIAMVFQNYALYPHMTVFDNISFGLQIRRVPKADIKEKVAEAAKILGLEEYLDRKPKELSGGQRQRVALGRCIVRNPKVFLMDEPLSNLDAKLRVQMRSEITKIHQKVGATTVYVTHDQTEAMTMADRIVIMKDGYIQQIGTPKEVYNNPANMFVAGFIGAPATNFITCEYDNGKISLGDSFSYSFDKEQIKKHDEFYEALLEKRKADYEKHLRFIEEYNESIKGQKRKKPIVVEEDEELKYLEELIAKAEEMNKTKKHSIVLGVRPEDVVLDDKSSIVCNCDVVELLGHELIIYTYLEGQRLIMKTDANENVKQGDNIKINFNHAAVHYFDPDTTNQI